MISVFGWDGLYLADLKFAVRVSNVQVMSTVSRVCVLNVVLLMGKSCMGVCVCV